MEWPQHLILVGLMGAGKSSVGRAAAAALHHPFVDTDQLVANSAGMPIARIFEEHGEAEFRRVETLAIQRLMYLPESVVATGGGAVLRTENWDYMQAFGIIFYLHISPEESMIRTAGDTDRPLLHVTDRLQRLRDLYNERHSLYARADHTIDSWNLQISEVADKVVCLYQQTKYQRSVEIDRHEKK